MGIALADAGWVRRALTIWLCAAAAAEWTALCSGPWSAAGGCLVTTSVLLLPAAAISVALVRSPIVAQLLRWLARRTRFWRPRVVGVRTTLAAMVFVLAAVLALSGALLVPDAPGRAHQVCLLGALSAFVTWARLVGATLAGRLRLALIVGILLFAFGVDAALGRVSPFAGRGADEPDARLSAPAAAP